jgi:hypothetical protein
MCPSNIKRIQEVMKKELEWATDKLVFKIVEGPSFDMIPYLGMGPKLHKMLSFFNPTSLTLAQIIKNFKVQEAIKEGVHLSGSRLGIFFKLACNQHHLYAKRAKSDNKNNNSNGSSAQLYVSGVKIGAPQFSRKMHGPEGCKIKCKTETGQPLAGSRGLLPFVLLVQDKL